MFAPIPLSAHALLQFASRKFPRHYHVLPKIVNSTFASYGTRPSRKMISWHAGYHSQWAIQVAVVADALWFAFVASPVVIIGSLFTNLMGTSSGNSNGSYSTPVSVRGITHPGCVFSFVLNNRPLVRGRFSLYFVHAVLTLLSFAPPTIRQVGIILLIGVHFRAWTRTLNAKKNKYY